MKIAQPLAFPDAVGERLDRDALRVDAQYMRETANDFLWLGVEWEQGLQARVRPQPELAGCRFENRIVVLIRVRHGHRAELEASFLDALHIEPVEIQGESQLRQGDPGYFRPRRRSR